MIRWLTYAYRVPRWMLIPLVFGWLSWCIEGWVRLFT